MGKILYTCALVLALISCSSEKSVQADERVTNERPAKFLFGGALVGSDQRSASFGGYAKGCLAGAAQLPETGPTWQAMRLSRNRNWGHPNLIEYVKNLSAEVAKLPGWNGLYVGDLSQPRGGPMLSGHASHQIGLDADIWMLSANRLDLTPEERENISSISLRRQAGAYTNDNWTWQHHQVLKAAASDPKVARIFVFPGAKVKMCNDEKGDRSWLNKIRPWWGHHYHFHVRLKCQPGSRNCVDQAPPPPGDGCDDAQGWVDRILNPPPPGPSRPPKAPITLSKMAKQCVGVLGSH